MKLKLVSALMALLLLTGVAALADDGKDKDKDKDGKSRNLTGCLQKGEDANEYMLTARDGSTWEVSAADGVALAPHVGHTVTITGTASTIHAKAHEAKEKAKDEASEHGMTKESAEHGHLKVTNVTMVSDSCKP